MLGMCEIRYFIRVRKKVTIPKNQRFSFNHFSIVQMHHCMKHCSNLLRWLACVCPLIPEDLRLFCYIILRLIFTTLFPTLSLPVGGTGSNIHEFITAVLQTGIQGWQTWICGTSFRILEDKNYCVFSVTCWLETLVSSRNSKNIIKYSSWLFDKDHHFFLPLHLPSQCFSWKSVLSQILSQGDLWCSGNYHILVLAWWRPEK